MSEIKTNLSGTEELELLFNSGEGVKPPWFSGREKEKDYYNKAIRRLVTDKPPGASIIVFGPRGNGKTSLLRHLESKTREEYGRSIDLLWTTPADISNRSQLMSLLVSGVTEKGIKTMVNAISKLVRIRVEHDAGFIEVGIPGIKERIYTNETDILRERCKLKPFVLMIDEAHELDPEVAKGLLNASQNVRGEGYKFLLVLAGTPNIKVTLSKASSTFWDKCACFSLGRLSNRFAVEALGKPLLDQKISFSPDVAEEVAVVRAQGYPVFIQQWGEALSRNLVKTGSKIITMDMVTAVEKDAAMQRNTIYESRKKEIREAGLLPVAEALAGAFLQQEQIQVISTENIVEDFLLKNPLSETVNNPVRYALETFNHTGFIWQTIGGEDNDIDYYEPGIPSLMSNILKNKVEETRDVMGLSQ